MEGELPERVQLLRRAQRDLDRIPPRERTRIIDDVVRLASRTFPGEIKPIASLPRKPLQADSGRFRILHLWDGPILWVLAIFARSQQQDVFRRFRRNPRTPS